MIYIFDKKQAIIKALTNDDFTAAHLNFKINTATTFEFSLPASKALPSGSKYVATPHPLNDSKFIMLRLTERVDNTETIDYSAYELAYQELATDGYIEDKRPQNQSALNLMKIALDGSNWGLNNVNVSGAATTNFYYVDRLSAISRVVDLLGGEIVFYIEIQGNAISGRYMDYLARQGADTSKVFASGSNLLTVERQSDTSNIYTAILPRGKGEEIDNGEADTPDGYGRRINIADVEWKKSAGKPLDKPKGSIVLSDPDATAEWGQINGNARLLLQTYDDIDDVNVLINSAYKTLQSVNHPQIQYSATVADVGGLSLGDTALIMHGDRDLSYKTRVFEVKYDLLSPDQTELSLGDDLSSNSITSQLNSLNAVADTTSSQTQWTINQIGRPGTTYGATAPNSPKVGDIWFKYLADGGTEIYRWNGDIWELLASPTTADDIAAAVTDAVTQANSHTDEVKQGLSSDIATAKSQAASQASTAEANAKSAATSQFNQAQSALSAAKTDLTNSIASEASARNAAVAAANSQAQTYANQAKADALNTIAKEVTDRQNAVSALDTKATNAVNQAKSDINDTIKALSVGGRNLYITETQVTGYINGSNGTLAAPNSINNEMASDYIAVLPNTEYTFQAWGSLLSGQNYWAGIGQYDSNKSFLDRSASIYGPIATTDIPNDYEKRTFTTSANTYFVRVSSRTYGNYRVKFEQGNLPTDWTNAPEDVVLDYTTKDNQIKATITQYQTTNDGKVSKAQTDATTALGQVATKVSQTDYDTKTGDLTTKYTEVKQTADSQAADIVDIKKTATSQASKINSISSDVDGTKQSISDIETTQDSQSDKINQITTDVNGTKQSITDIQTRDDKQDTRMGTIETSVSGVKSDFSSYKTTNDGVVKTAQATAQTAVDGLKTKVSQTDYNTKTGQLQTDLTTTTQTANQAKTDIASIKQKDGDQDAKMNTIVFDANGTKQTISDLQTAQGKQSGYISTLQQRADGFDATVTKVDSLGQINQLFNTEFSPDFQGWYDRGLYGKGITTSLGAPVNGSNVFMKVDGGPTRLQSAPIAVIPGTKMSYSIQKLASSSVWSYINNVDANGNMVNVPGTSSPEFGAKNSVGYTKVENITIPSGVVYISFGILLSGISNGNVFSQPMLVFSDHVGTYVQGNYNNNGSTAKAQLTADNAALAISDYKTNADGRISQAQADIKANATAITTRVSQTDYDKKTGDLTTAVSKAQTTADGVVTTVGNYQTSNDKRVKAAESAISQNADAIALKVAKTDYDSNNSQLNTRFTKVEATANGTATTVSELKSTVNSLGQINQLFNTEFSPDFAGWINGNYAPFVVDGSYNGSTRIRNTATVSGNRLYSGLISVQGVSVVSTSVYNDDWSFVRGYDENKKLIGELKSHIISSQGLNVMNGISIPSTVYYINFGVQSGVNSYVSQPMLVFASTIGTYVQGNYNNNAALAQVKITADSISNFVRDSSGNISSEFQTALSRTSIITGSTLATSIQTQTATQISSAITDNNGKIISLINQDSSGIQIAGKNIVLNGDTTVTGAFKVSQANIANGAIGTAQIGDASITSAKIATIDAGKITTGVLNSITANSMTLNAGTINGAAIYVTSMQNQIDGTTQNVRLGINPNWQHQLHIEPVNQSSGWHHYLYAGNDHLFLGAWDGSNSNTYDNRVALFTEGGSSEIDVGTIRLRSSGSAIYDNGWGSIDGVTSISMKGSDPSYTSMYVGVGNNGTGELRVVTNATIGTSNLNYADARAAHWYTSSLAKYKTNISEMEDGSALEMINRAGIYRYQFKTDAEAGNDKYTFGPVIGADYLNNPIDFLDSLQEGTDDHSASWITMKALQEEDSKVEALIARIEELEEKLESVGK
ncbi:phage tail spike protein [Leuconostoc falkenbergense]|uniref:phage tail spike protein n=4 Tax=Leuconostoc falkenbergense TaxID=2766470 RepID=UPI003896B7D4